MQILKQHKLPFVGAIKDAIDQAMGVIGILNFMLGVPTAYTIWVKAYVPRMSLAMFFGILIAIIVILMFCAYKYLMPSYYAHRARQYQNDNQKKMLEAICLKLGIRPEDME